MSSKLLIWYKCVGWSLHLKIRDLSKKTFENKDIELTEHVTFFVLKTIILISFIFIKLFLKETRNFYHIFFH